MPLPASPHRRALKHTRNLQVEFYLREDELWDIEAHFSDVKPFDLEVTSLVIPANRPVHDFWIRVTTDARSNIVGVRIVFDQVPFKGHCEKIEAEYQKLIGLNLLHHFRQDVRERLGKTAGCTHMNELVELLPYVAVQVLIFGEKTAREKAAFQKSGERPFHLDGCHALKTDGPVVAQFYPEWSTRNTPQKKEPG
ncbi:MAG: DUF2889 domain-containing protein [Oxalobacter formigenes]|nr:DUF2889 domain-containing protein [Oxalobacter formigenes]